MLNESRKRRNEIHTKYLTRQIIGVPLEQLAIAACSTECDRLHTNPLSASCQSIRRNDSINRPPPVSH